MSEKRPNIYRRHDTPHVSISPEVVLFGGNYESTNSRQKYKTEKMGNIYNKLGNGLFRYMAINGRIFIFCLFYLI